MEQTEVNGAQTRLFLAAAALSSHSLPSTRRVTSMEAMVSPEAFPQVAAGSHRHPRVAPLRTATAGKLHMEPISHSPTRPPPGAPERTKADRIATTMAMP